MFKTYTPEDILSLLEAGKSSDDLAQEFTAALNDAIALQEEQAKEKAAAEEARRLADEARAKAHEEQLADAQAILDSIYAYLAKWYPSVNLEVKMPVEEFVGSLSAMVNATKEIQSRFKDFELLKSWKDTDILSALEEFWS